MRMLQVKPLLKRDRAGEIVAENVHWEVDNSQVMRELNRLSKGISHKLAKELTFLIEQAFDDTQRVVHQAPRISPGGYVNTSSLKNSGRVETSTNRRRNKLGRFSGGYEWEGSIEYGGPSLGSVHEYVDYAGYEQNYHNEEGSHDFMIPAYAYEPLFEQAILRWYTEDDI
jgi:hypothetical protein